MMPRAQFPVYSVPPPPPVFAAISTTATGLLSLTAQQRQPQQPTTPKPLMDWRLMAHAAFQARITGQPIRPHPTSP